MGTTTKTMVKTCGLLLAVTCVVLVVVVVVCVVLAIKEGENKNLGRSLCLAQKKDKLIGKGFIMKRSARIKNSQPAL